MIHLISLGYYIYIEATGKNQDEKATITHTIRDAAKPHCLAFWYHMYGHHIGSLIVEADNSVLWEKRGNLTIPMLTWVIHVK